MTLVTFPSIPMIFIDIPIFGWFRSPIFPYISPLNLRRKSMAHLFRGHPVFHRPWRSCLWAGALKALQSHAEGGSLKMRVMGHGNAVATVIQWGFKPFIRGSKKQKHREYEISLISDG